MNEDGYLQSESSVKADILNKQFQSVYTREDTDSIPEKGPSPYQPMQDISINPNGAKKLLKDIKPYKAAGPDGIPTYILRSAAEELSPILSCIYQFSLDTGSVPSDWRKALIVPLFKKGLKHMASNYGVQTCVTNIRSMQSARAHCSQQHHATPRPEQHPCGETTWLSQETVNCYPAGCYHPRHRQ